MAVVLNPTTYFITGTQWFQWDDFFGTDLGDLFASFSAQTQTYVYDLQTLSDMSYDYKTIVGWDAGSNEAADQYHIHFRPRYYNLYCGMLLVEVHVTRIDAPHLRGNTCSHVDFLISTLVI